MGPKAYVLLVISLILWELIIISYSGGGADGSMLIFPDVEPNFAANNGIIDSVNDLQPFLASGKFPTITAGDMIQFGATVAVGLCPVHRLFFLGLRND